MLGDFEDDMRHRPARRTGKRHARFFWRAIALFDIAFQAGGNDVVPAVEPAARAGDDVINGQIVPFVATVLTGVIVAVEDIATRQADFFVGYFDVGTQTNHRRQRCIRVNQATIMLDLLSFAFHEQHHRSTPCADIERLVGSVKDQDLRQYSPQCAVSKSLRCNIITIIVSKCLLIGHSRRARGQVVLIFLTGPRLRAGYFAAHFPMEGEEILSVGSPT